MLIWTEIQFTNSTNGLLNTGSSNNPIIELSSVGTKLNHNILIRTIIAAHPDLQ